MTLPSFTIHMDGIGMARCSFKRDWISSDELASQLGRMPQWNFKMLVAEFVQT